MNLTDILFCRRNGPLHVASYSKCSISIHRGASPSDKRRCQMSTNTRMKIRGRNIRPSPKAGISRKREFSSGGGVFRCALDKQPNEKLLAGDRPQKLCCRAAWLDNFRADTLIGNSSFLRVAGVTHRTGRWNIFGK